MGGFTVWRAMVLVGGVGLGLLAACSNTPPPGAPGAAAGGPERRLLAGLTAGGTLSGYLVGANWDMIVGNRTNEAQRATEKAATRPAQAADVWRSDTGDLNRDGFVTLDEVVALQRAGLSDPAILQRLQATGQIFEVLPEQQGYLARQGVHSLVIAELGELNADRRQALLQQRYPMSPPPPVLGSER